MKEFVINDIASRLKDTAETIRELYVYKNAKDIANDLEKWSDDLIKVTKEAPRYNLGPSEIFIDKLKGDIRGFLLERASRKICEESDELFRSYWNKSVDEYNEKNKQKENCCERKV